MNPIAIKIIISFILIGLPTEALAELGGLNLTAVGSQSVKSVVSVYNELSLRISLSYPSAKAISFISDELNRIKQIKDATVNIISQYSYVGPLRVKEQTYGLNKVTEVLQFYYDGTRCIEERDGLDILLRQYVFGNGIDEVLQRTDYNPAGNITNEYYFHENSLGSTYAVTEANGNVIERYKYTAYGQPSILAPDGTSRSESIIGNRILFTGREYDTETGLYYYRARYYSPILGRFLQRDMLLYDDIPNLYEYVRNNPINKTDLSGLQTPVQIPGMEVPPEEAEHTGEVFEWLRERGENGGEFPFGGLCDFKHTESLRTRGVIPILDIQPYLESEETTKKRLRLRLWAR